MPKIRALEIVSERIIVLKSDKRIKKTVDKHIPFVI